jgi:hypothetical protein
VMVFDLTGPVVRASDDVVFPVGGWLSRVERGGSGSELDKLGLGGGPFASEAVVVGLSPAMLAVDGALEGGPAFSSAEDRDGNPSTWMVICTGTGGNDVSGVKSTRSGFLNIISSAS